MSYSLGTKLSYANGAERAVLFDEDKVMVTMADGQVIRQVLYLRNWIVFANGQEIVADTSNVAKAAEQRAKALATTYPEHPIGTKLKWINGEASSTIIVTKKGFLEVKRAPVLNDRPRTMYVSELAWRTTLPCHIGSTPVFTVTPPTPTLIQQKLLPIPEGLTDIEKMEELSRRFNYSPTCVICLSPKMEADSQALSIDKLKEKLALAGEVEAFDIARQIHCLTPYANACQLSVREMTEEQQNLRSIRVYNRSPTCIYVDVKGRAELIGLYINQNGETCIAYNGGPQNAKTCQELGLTGLNKLSIVYRKKTYTL